MDTHHDTNEHTGQTHDTSRRGLDAASGLVRAIAASEFLPGWMDEIAARMRREFDADFCGVLTLENDEFHFRASAFAPNTKQNTLFFLNNDLLRQVCDTQEPFVSEALKPAPDGRFVQASRCDDPSCVAHAAFPLMAGGRPVGVLCLSFSQAGWASHKVDTDSLQNIAYSLGLAIENERLHGQLETHQQELDVQAQERRELDLEVLHSQKLVSLGRLSSQAAHDFNNMLSVIMGFNEYARDELPPLHPAQDHLEKVAAASIRARSLTRQLLAFAHKEMIAAAVVKLQPLLRDTAQMLLPLLGPRICLEIDVLTKRDTVLVDAGQIEHVLVNLMVNARDAMSGVGTLTLRLESVQLGPDEDGLSSGLPPGEYVRLEVCDTGCGIAEEASRKIFEPFYTTKLPGKGTGLGLAACHDAIKHNHGSIEMESSLGNGSVFRILLPYVAPKADSGDVECEDLLAADGSEGVLLAESENLVREAAAAGLRRYGYSVHGAASGREALEAVVAFPERFTILVTETMLSDMTGQELSSRLRARIPHVRTLFATSQSQTGTGGDACLEDRAPLAKKPYTPAELASRVRAVIDAPEPESSP